VAPYDWPVLAGQILQVYEMVTEEGTARRRVGVDDSAGSRVAAEAV